MVFIICLAYLTSYRSTFILHSTTPSSKLTHSRAIIWYGGSVNDQARYLCCSEKYHEKSKAHSKMLGIKKYWIHILKLVYDRNQYIGLGPIPKPKPKLANTNHTFVRYRNQYRNHISEGKSSYQKYVWGIFSIIKGPLKPKFAAKY